MSKRIWTGLAGAALVALVAALPARADFQSDWKELIASAQKEGKVVISAVPGTGMRKKLPEVFKEKFGVEWRSSPPSRQSASARRWRKPAPAPMDCSPPGSRQIRVVYPRPARADEALRTRHREKECGQKGEPWFTTTSGAHVRAGPGQSQAFVTRSMSIPRRSSPRLLDPRTRARSWSYDPTRPGPDRTPSRTT